MSVLIKGMKKPKDCYQCRLHYGNGECGVSIDGNCPLIELPDHGDLIDRNMLIGGFADWYLQESPMYLGDNKVVAETIGDAMKAIEAAPVIIPAERSEASLCDNCDQRNDNGCCVCKYINDGSEE